MDLLLALVAHRTADLVDTTDIIHLWVITAVTTAVITVTAPATVITTVIIMSRGVDPPQMVFGAMTLISMMTSSRILTMNWMCLVRQYGTHAPDVMLLEDAEDILMTLAVEATRMDEPQD